jgi:hypothetical protein
MIRPVPAAPAPTIQSAMAELKKQTQLYAIAGRRTNAVATLSDQYISAANYEANVLLRVDSARDVLRGLVAASLGIPEGLVAATITELGEMLA